MSPLSRISQACRALVLVAVALALIPSLAMADHIKMRDDGVAIQGYDAVAYFTMGRPTQGKPEFEHIWNESRWWFATAEHRDLFAVDPERYAPRFGGFCTGGLSLGYKMVADPENWYIADGSLHLHHSSEGRAQALADLDTVLARAEETWEKLRGD